MKKKLLRDLDNLVMEKQQRKMREKEREREVYRATEREKKHHYSDISKANNPSENNPLVGRKCPHGNTLQCSVCQRRYPRNKLQKYMTKSARRK